MYILTNSDFDILVDIENQLSLKKKKLNILTDISDIAARTFNTLKTVHSCINKLITINYLIEKKDELSITQQGYDYLKPYRVKKAIFMAAGKGSRLFPVTSITPKPLIPINGKVLIESLLDTLYEKGITDITIVIGYLSEKFNYLTHKYPSIKFIYNDNYMYENNISSAIKVKDFFSNAYVLDSDLLLNNKSLIRKYEKCSNYLGIFSKKTDDWVVTLKDKKIISMQKGGINAYRMVGISYWTEKDGIKLSHDLSNVYDNPQNRSCYWDDVPLNFFNNNYEIFLRQCNSNDVIEIDTLQELIQNDSSYSQYNK